MDPRELERSLQSLRQKRLVLAIAGLLDSGLHADRAGIVSDVRDGRRRTALASYRGRAAMPSMRLAVRESPQACIAHPAFQRPAMPARESALGRLVGLLDTGARMIQAVLDRIPGAHRSGNGWIAKCPAHEDRIASLSIAEGNDGRTLLRCHAGCELSAILEAINLEPRDLFPEPPARTEKPRVVARYVYTDPDAGEGTLRVCKMEPKKFFQEIPDDRGGWKKRSGEEWNPVPYRAPELKAAPVDEVVYFVEGEKDVETLRAQGFTATCNLGGAGKWKPELNEYFRGRHVVIVPDNDEPGQKHAQAVAEALLPVAASVRILDLGERLNMPPKGDVSDFFAKGGLPEHLRELAESTPPFLFSPFPLGSVKKKEKQDLKFILLSDLLAEPEDEGGDFIVNGLLPAGGSSILGAPPKSGKTTFVRTLAYRVARGEPFLGRETRQGPVMVVLLEEKRVEIHRAFARMPLRGGEPIYLVLEPLPREGWEDWLRTQIAAIQPVLLIIDPLFKLCRVRDLNDYSQVQDALETLHNIARETGCHILVVHHTGKTEREGSEGILGSQAIRGAFDSLLVMRRKGDVRTIFAQDVRYGEELKETVLYLDPDTGLVSAAGRLDDMKLAETLEEVLSRIRDDGEMEEKQICKAIGGNRGLVGKALREGVKAGQITRAGAGRRGDPYIYSVDLVSPFESQILGKNEKTETDFLAPGGIS